jgi:hypothetical protein
VLDHEKQAIAEEHTKIESTLSDEASNLQDDLGSSDSDSSLE